MVRAKAGDADAFAGLMHLYERRIIGIGIQMGLSREDALDACQDSFVKVFRYIGRFRSGESFFKWLYRIAINTIYDHLRINRPAEIVSLEEVVRDGRQEIADGAEPMATRLENADLVNKLVAEIGCLTRQERIVFVLRDLHAMPTDEIGRVLSLSQVTIRRHCMSARGKLRDRLFPRKP
ncbi:MAG TPA: sigma-70 family RNA polymerase sigma factor [Candidatus Polarisedimenticolia bacterium]|nr:sigma-70 family RNA polymerase sigma factor [Candidatus Polarisedimenticolia bacterium]